MLLIRNTLMPAVLVLLLWSCGSQKPEPDSIVRKVKVEQVILADTVQMRVFPGRVHETAEISLAFRVAGPIARLAVREGDYVQAGQLIALMDSRDYRIQLQAAQAQYEQVKAEAERIIELHNRQSVARNDYDKAVSGLLMVEAQLKHAMDQLNDTRLLAPTSGYIQKVNFRENELVDAGMPVATLLDVSRYLVELDIPVSLYAGRDGIISFAGSQPQLGEEEFLLQLLSISRKASHNQLYRVQLAADPAKVPGLAPGMDVQVHVLTRTENHLQVCVPLTAVFRRGDKSFVFVYDVETETVLGREVLPGSMAQTGRIRISSGLQPGDQVVVAGVSLISDHERVALMEEVSATNVGGML